MTNSIRLNGVQDSVRGFFKTHPMLSPVLRSFLIIPFEAVKLHYLVYTQEEAKASVEVDKRPTECNLRKFGDCTPLLGVLVDLAQHLPLSGGGCEQELQRAEQLAKRLRELGVEPNL